jgi:hypothetical protein
MSNRYLLIGILYSIIIVFYSCNDDTGSNDTTHITNFIYNNETDVPVTVEYHYTIQNDENSDEKLKLEVIEAGGTLKEQMIIPGMKSVILIDCNSIRIIFNDKKEVWYYQDKYATQQDSPFQIENYEITRISKEEVNCTYKINQKIFDLATDIE